VVGALATAYFLGLSWFSHTPAAASPSAGEGALVAAGIAALHGAAFTCVICRAEPQKAIHPLLLTLAGPLLVGLLFSYALKLYQLPRGTLIGVVFFFGIKGNDIAAYLVGKAIGRIRFLKVSPRKTLEGCLAAVVFSIGWFTAVGALWPAVFFPWPWAVPAGILLSISSQIGDLSESVLKRAYGVKDSGILLPEFGGVLDLIDSTLLSGFLFWSFLQG
jgi:phosphatidate cytidylyltransferase